MIYDVSFGVAELAMYRMVTWLALRQSEGKQSHISPFTLPSSRLFFLPTPYCLLRTGQIHRYTITPFRFSLLPMPNAE